MKTVPIFSFCLVGLVAVSSTFALDRDANIIDAVKIEGASYDDSDYAGLRITGERRVADSSGQWALLSALGAGQLSLDGGEDYDSTLLGVGIKYYLTTFTSLSLMGHYTWNSADVDFEVGQLNASIKQRLRASENAISPYVILDAGVQFVDQDRSYEVLVLAAIAGCDLMMNESMAIVFEGGISRSEDIDNGTDRADGAFASIAMQYYWK